MAPKRHELKARLLVQVLQRAEEVCVISAEATQEAATEVRLAQLAQDFSQLDVPVQSLVDLPDVYVLGDLAVCHAGLEDCLATAHSIPGPQVRPAADLQLVFAPKTRVWLGWDAAMLSGATCRQQARLLLLGADVHGCNISNGHHAAACSAGSPLWVLCRQQERLRSEAEAQTAKVRSALAYLETWQQCQRLWLSMGSLYSSQVPILPGLHLDLGIAGADAGQGAASLHQVEPCTALSLALGLARVVRCNMWSYPVLHTSCLASSCGARTALAPVLHPSRACEFGEVREAASTWPPVPHGAAVQQKYISPF